MEIEEAEYTLLDEGVVIKDTPPPTPYQNKKNTTVVRYQRFNEYWTDFIKLYPVEQYNSPYFCSYFTHLGKLLPGTNLWPYHSALSDLLLRTQQKSISDYDGYKLVKDTINGLVKEQKTEQAAVLSDKVVSDILAFYPEEGKDLMLKTFFVIGLFAAFRIDDLDQITRDLIQFNSANRTVKIILNRSKTGPCEQIIPGMGNQDHPCCPYRIIKLYYDTTAKSNNMKGSLWMRYIQKKNGQGYFGIQKIGINTLRKWIKEILGHPKVYPQLPEDVRMEHENKMKHPTNHGKRIGLDRFTGHTLRRTAATLLSSLESVNFNELQRLGRWKSAATSQRYIENNEESKARTVRKLLNSVTGEEKVVVEDNNPSKVNLVINATKVIYLTGDNNTINM